MRTAFLLAALLSVPAATAQVGVRASFDADAETWVLLGAANLDDDPANELVLGVPTGLSLSRIVIRDGVTGEVEWDSADLLTDASIRVAGWSGSYAGPVGTGVREFAVVTERYGDSPFVDADGDGRVELVFFESNADRLYVIGAGGWRPAPSASR